MLDDFNYNCVYFTQYERGQVLRLLSIALRNWSVHGGDSSLSDEDAKSEANQCIDEAIEIFKRYDAKMISRKYFHLLTAIADILSHQTSR